MDTVEIKRCFKPIFQNEYSYLIYKGGRSSGKSWGIADSLIMVSRMQNARILCTREFQSSISSSSYQLLVDRINHFGLSDFKITKTEIVNDVTGSSFIFKGLSDITGTDKALKSIEGITHAWVEEAQTVSKSSWDILTPSIRGENAKIIISYNPDTEQDPVYQEFVLNPRPKTFICHLNYLDNKYCSEKIINDANHLKTNKEDEYRNIWLGEMRDMSKNAVVKYFAKDNINPDIKYCDDLPLYLSMDFNVDPMMWVVSHKTDDKIFVFDEIVMENVTTFDAITEFLNRYGKHKEKIIINGDASGNYRKTQSKYSDYAIVKNALEQRGFKVDFDIRGFNPPIKNRINAFNQMILSNDGKRKWFCSDKCEWLIFNLKNLKYKTGSSEIDLPSFNQVKKDTKSKFLGHIFDAVSYQAEYYFPVLT